MSWRRDEWQSVDARGTLSCIWSLELVNIARQWIGISLLFAASSTIAPAQITQPGIEFFNEISGELEIELTRPPERIGNLANLRAPAGAKIKTLVLKAGMFDEAADEERPLTAKELGRVVISRPTIQLKGAADIVVTHAAPNGKFFTVADILKAIELTERQTRDKSEWFGGIDIHHIYLEGLHDAGNGVWEIHWES